jgi:hypothetical protein
MTLAVARRLAGRAPSLKLHLLALARGPLPFDFGLLAKRRRVLPLDSLLRPRRALGDAMRRTIRQFAYVCDILTFIRDLFAIVGQCFALIGDPFAFSCDAFTVPCGAYDRLIHGTQTPLR